MSIMPHTLNRMAGAMLLAMATALPSLSQAQTATGFHFDSICRSDPTASKNTVTLVLHGPDDQDATGSWLQNHMSLAGVTINALWTYVDYRQNHAVFQYKQASCTTAADGSCTFHGGSGRARWQLSEVVGYNMSSPAFDTEATATCPNTLMIDFW
ncbi:MAG: hypothetical protein WC685_04945 [Methylobacter sp.]